MTRFLVVSLSCVLWSCSEPLPELMTEEESEQCVAKRNGDLSWFKENCEDRIGEVDGFARSVDGNALDLHLTSADIDRHSLGAGALRVSGWRDHFERKLYEEDEIRVTGRFVVTEDDRVEVEATGIERLAYSMAGMRAEEGATRVEEASSRIAEYNSEQEQARVAYAACAENLRAGNAHCPMPTSHIRASRINGNLRLEMVCSWGSKILVVNCRYYPSSKSAMAEVVSAQ